MNDANVVGDQLRRLRVARHLGQTELAEALGNESGNSVISRIETKRTIPDPDFLEQIAQYLDVTVDFFYTPTPDLLATKPWLRAFADAPVRTLESYLEENLIFVAAIKQLKLRRIADSIPQYDGDPDDETAIERFAEECRTEAGVDEAGAVRNAVRATERLGVAVLPMDDELGRHLGLSQRVDDVPVIRVSRPSNDEAHTVPGDRQRFTVIHELGHLAMHSSTPPPVTPAEGKRIERQAHRFAAAFLAPAGPLMQDLDELGGRITLSNMAQLKARWGVAIKMLVTRFHHLGVIEHDQARSLYKQISARGWAKREPVPVTNEGAVWLSRAMAEKTGTDELKVPAANLGPSHYTRWTTWSPLEARDADILPMAPRDRAQTSLLWEADGDGDAASVTHLRRPRHS